jgi:hypothetical protein
MPRLISYKRAARRWQRNHSAERRRDQDWVDYRVHYNARLNKYLNAEAYISSAPVGINMWVYLSDLQANRIYGGFHRSANLGLFYCNLEDKECHSELCGTQL